LRDSLDVFNNFQKNDGNLQRGSSTTTMSDIALQLSHSLNFILKFVECPFLFVSSQFVSFIFIYKNK
jgi:hypothetical protein